MSQLFSQPDTTPKVTRARPTPEKSPKARAEPRLPGSPPAPPGGNNSTTRTRPVLRWWERQTTTELEVAGIVEDVINPSLLLAAGRPEAGGGKPMAVASLRELWDEEKERSRAAGGGSQLSAPPGLELADSQDAWEPPEGLLTQHVKDDVEVLARNVFGRGRRKTTTTPSSQGAGGSSQPGVSQNRSQVSTGASESGEPSDGARLPSSQEEPLSQASAADVAGASSSPANCLPSQGAMNDGDDVDQGLLDMITALRGSQQSQGVENESLSSAGRRYSQSPAGSLSQKPAFTPEPSADQAEAVAATQVRIVLVALIQVSCVQLRRGSFSVDAEPGEASSLACLR